MKISTLSLFILFTLSPECMGASKFHIDQMRFNDPLFDILEPDIITIEHVYSRYNTVFPLDEIKHGLIDANSDNKNDKKGNSSVNPTADLEYTSVTNPKKMEKVLTSGFTLSVAEDNLSKSVGETATYHFSIQGNNHWQGSICLSLASSLPGAKLSKQRIRPGETFSLSVPSSINSRWGDYMFTITAAADNDHWVKQQRVNLRLLPSDMRQIEQSNLTELSITDNTPEGIMSGIMIEDAITAFDVRILVKISHPLQRELSMTLTSPMGTIYKLENQSNVTKDNRVQEYQTDHFNNEPINGNWVLKVSDLAAGDRGSLLGWQLFISGYIAM
ncbi:proprotein convertase P-domain-containing protein [Shewanella sp. AS1]|uniref:proprotein convertase P-domain-containing protein n=1 Tax=Shewanella sp. AS1 TaxID=2907626 RepID=UPI001F339DE2|nr:proprotein convertase P-domain-containing protein [Shewanella sp. AS1]MCE9678622.1 proprotein convertase P-domain-containing protein [Shewanella sp. AS1]